MSIGRGTDDDRIDIPGCLDRLYAAHLGAVLRGKITCRLRHGIGDGNEFCLGIGGYGLGVNLADTAGAEKAKTDSHLRELHPFRRQSPGPSN